MNTARYIQATLPAGENQVLDGRLRRQHLLKVKMDGIGYDIVYGAPQGRQVLHRPLLGIAAAAIFPDQVISDQDRDVYFLIRNK